MKYDFGTLYFLTMGVDININCVCVCDNHYIIFYDLVTLSTVHVESVTLCLILRHSEPVYKNELPLCDDGIKKYVHVIIWVIMLETKHSQIKYLCRRIGK